MAHKPADIPPVGEIRRPGMDHDLYPFRTPDQAPRIAWPHGARTAFTVTLMLDHWEVNPPQDAHPDPRILSPLGKFFPDCLTWSQRHKKLHRFLHFKSGQTKNREEDFANFSVELIWINTVSTFVLFCLFGVELNRLFNGSTQHLSATSVGVHKTQLAFMHHKHVSGGSTHVNHQGGWVILLWGHCSEH